MACNIIVSANGLMGCHSVVPREKLYGILGHPAMDVENEEFLIPDTNSSPMEDTLRWGNEAPKCTEASVEEYIRSVST